MKKLLLKIGATVSIVLVVGIAVIFTMGGAVKVDYTTEELEQALNNGEDVEGKTVEVDIRKIEPNSAFGYNAIAGAHLNFVSPTNPKVEAGDTMIVKIEKVSSMLGSFIITYKK